MDVRPHENGNPMLALKVEVDGQPFAIAGVEDWALISAHITASRGNPTASNDFARSDRIQLSVGGLSIPDAQSLSHHLRWGNVDLALGSSVRLTFLETDRPEPAKKRYRSDSSVQENPFTEEEMRAMRRKDYEALKKEFGGGGEV
jgi:hypothetical protein